MLIPIQITKHFTVLRQNMGEQNVTDMAVPTAAEQEVTQGLSISKSQHLPDIASQHNTLFEKLNQDTRNVIYSYLSFPLLRHLHNDDGSAFTLMFRQEYQETVEEGAGQFWFYLQTVK
jgi:hypothetical protein